VACAPAYVEGNELSPEAGGYFAAGGNGILIGDGQLKYRPEKIIEAYYIPLRL
jgi:high affinity Mn2+ porin